MRFCPPPHTRRTSRGRRSRGFHVVLADVPVFVCSKSHCILQKRRVAALRLVYPHGLTWEDEQRRLSEGTDCWRLNWIRCGYTLTDATGNIRVVYIKTVKIPAWWAAPQLTLSSIYTLKMSTVTLHSVFKPENLSGEVRCQCSGVSMSSWCFSLIFTKLWKFLETAGCLFPTFFFNPWNYFLSQTYFMLQATNTHTRAHAAHVYDVMQMWGSQPSAWRLGGRPHTPQLFARNSESHLRTPQRMLTCLILLSYSSQWHRKRALNQPFSHFYRSLLVFVVQK